MREPPPLTRAQQRALNGERVGPPMKCNRYNRVEDKEAYADGVNRVFGERDPKSFQTGGRTHKTYRLKSREELDRQNNR